jgi:divalent metal cation (Fe/Co/Zn/Cd) transporter
MAPPLTLARHRVVRRGQLLTGLTIAYNFLEAILSIGAGIAAGSVALVGFGFDSVLELTSSLAALWRLGTDGAAHRRAQADLLALRIVGACFLLLAAYVLADAMHALFTHEVADESPIGIAIAAASLLVMPLLARAKRRVATSLASQALSAEARQTELCTWLSAILLGGLLLNATLGWWWADPMAALVMVPIIVWEGLRAVRGRTPCGDGCHVSPSAS